MAFDIGQGSQDLGFRGEVPILFEVKPGIPVKLSVIDFDGKQLRRDIAQRAVGVA